jgi:hypothetical protein
MAGVTDLRCIRVDARYFEMSVRIPKHVTQAASERTIGGASSR